MMDDLPHVLQPIRESEAYKTLESFDAMDAVDDYRTSCVAITAASRNMKLCNVLCSDLSTGSVVSSLNCTIKTHKDAGEVGPRAIHSFSNCAFAPGMRHIANMLIHMS